MFFDNTSNDISHYNTVLGTYVLTYNFQLDCAYALLYYCKVWARKVKCD